MKRVLYLVLIPCLWAGLTLPVFAGKDYNKPRHAMVIALDKKARIIRFSKRQYKIRIGVKIHSHHKLPSLSDIKTGQTIKYQTRKNPTNGQVEISEIWVIEE